MVLKTKRICFVMVIAVLTVLLSLCVFAGDVKGDVNTDGETDLIDAILLNMHLLKGKALTDEQLLEADCNEDGKVDANDVVALICLGLFGVKTPGEIGDNGIPKEECSVDFTVDVPLGKDVEILVLADTQLYNLDGVRETPGNSRFKQVYGAFFGDNPKLQDDYLRTWRYVEEGIENSDPDLIVIVGDVIYGESDDSGELWLEMCNTMDSYEIPWAVIFGNHDNESAKGVRWQIKQVENSKYGIIKRGNVTGNSNYTIGIRQGGFYKYILYMLDTNGCKTYTNPGEGIQSNNVDIKLIKQELGVYDDQINWMRESYKTYKKELGREVPTMINMHIPTGEIITALNSKYKDTRDKFPFVPTEEGDFGVSYESSWGFDTGGKLWAAAKFINCTDMFFGHQHQIAISIVYDGIRMTYGAKTGTHAMGKNYGTFKTGTTLVTISEDNGASKVEYMYSEYEHVIN